MKDIQMDTIDIDMLPLITVLDMLFGTCGKTSFACNYRPKASSKSNEPEFYPLPKSVDGTFYCPAIDRVIFNNNATIVIFKDGTKATVVKEPNDSYDRTTAVAYAIVKRLLATAYNTKTNAVNAAYINTIHDIVANGYDQQVEEAKKDERDCAAQARHEASQKQQQEKAFRRRVKNRVRDLQVEAAAQAELNGSKKTLNENTASVKNFIDRPKTEKALPRTSGLVQIDPKDAWKLYRRPDKPFSQFTNEEKKAYWRAHNAKRRALGK